jgi:hypothetical protein
VGELPSWPDAFNARFNKIFVTTLSMTTPDVGEYDPSQANIELSAAKSKETPPIRIDWL